MPQTIRARKPTSKKKKKKEEEYTDNKTTMMNTRPQLSPCHAAMMTVSERTNQNYLGQPKCCQLLVRRRGNRRCVFEQKIFGRKISRFSPGRSASEMNEFTLYLLLLLLFCLIFEGLWESGEEEEEVLKYLRIRKKISFDTGINQVEKGEKRREAAACCTVDYLHRRSSVSLSEGAHRLLAYFPAHVSSFFLSLRFRWFTQTAVSWEYVKLYYMTCIVTYFL